MKTKLGVSVGLLGAAAYFLGLFSGNVVLALLVGYVLLFEENEWLRRTVVKAMAIGIFFSVLTTVIGFIPDIIGIINNAAMVFGKTVSVSVVSKIITFIMSVISFVRVVLMLILGFKALNQGTIRLGVVDKTIDKHMK